MLDSLPPEVIRAVALHIYDPLELSQQDRLTWGIFSTVDMHAERQEALGSLVALGATSRAVREAVRPILFRCVRILSVANADEVAEADWAPFVRALIVDLSMFDDDTANPRSCWAESALLARAINALTNLQHLSFFADASDDSTLALLFASLIPRDDHLPAAHAIRARAQSQPPDVFTQPSSPLATLFAPSPSTPLADRLLSFGWRQRASPPSDLRSFAQTSTFASTLHVLRHAANLSFLVLDADMDEMHAADIVAAVRELAARQTLAGAPTRVSLMLCGPISGWDGFLSLLVDSFGDIKELFVDRPLKKTIRANTDEDEFVARLEPLSQLDHLTLVQVGSYTFSLDAQRNIARRLAIAVPTLLIVGLLAPEGDTCWWGVWRSDEGDIFIRPMGDGHLRRLEDCARASRRPSIASVASFPASGFSSRRSSYSAGLDEMGKRSRRTSVDEEGVGRKRQAIEGIRPLSSLSASYQH